MNEPKVLIVDDTPSNLIALAAVLQPLGVEVVQAKSGAEAIELVEHDTFAVVLLDVQMPKMDGFEVARRLRKMENGSELPIIFLTAIHRDELNVRHGYASGAADYITKPFDVDVLRARVRAFVDLFRQRDRLRVEQLSKLLESERAARREAEIANSAKDEFLATVSHELRTPLNAILGWSVIARDMTDQAQLQKALETIERNARSQMRIIEDIFDMARIVSGKLRLELADCVMEDAIRAAALTVKPAADAKAITLDVVIDSNLGSIAADKERLQQIVWNLLTNAIKFTPKSGRVTLTATRRDGEIFVEVRDNGHGIAPDFLPHVFDAFKQDDQSSTRRFGGLGLGLAIVKQLVDAHGGKITAASDGVGKGATFRLELPARTLGTPAKDDVVKDAARLDGIHVLVVDDDEESRTLLEHLLASHGARVTLAANAKDALRVVGHADIILSDIAMPDCDGHEFIRRVRTLPVEHGGRTPAIAFTATTRFQPDEAFQGQLFKPVDPERLLSLITNTVARH